MELRKLLREARKEGNLVLGYRKTLKSIKLHKPKLVVFASNLPPARLEELKHLCKLSKLQLQEFRGSSKELGVVCGKPFPVSALVIKK